MPTPNLPDASLPPAVSLGQAFWFWLKLGFVSFGGPAGQIGLMHQELVENRRWISEKRFLHALNYCMILPGPEAQQLATYIGWLMHRTRGGIIAGGLFVLPSLLILIALSTLYMVFGHTSAVEGLFYGIKPAVTAIVLQAAIRIGGRTLKNPLLWLIAAAAFLAIFAFNLPFPLIILGAAAVGWLGVRIKPAYFQSGKAHGQASDSNLPALIDDHTPTPEHAVFSWRGLLQVAGAGLLLWSVPLGLLCAWRGWNDALTQIGWFFTKAALLTFGGAYAVLPYVYQGAVETYQWLSPSQMMDGLALGETTPGPLIMVVTFVGFVGGYSQHLLVADSAFLTATLAAVIATWFTFLPSFVFILLGGPLVESTHQQIRLTAPLTAITAAVVGVIVNLALFFGQHVIFPHGLVSAPDWYAVCIALAACLALFKFKTNVIYVIAASAIAGLLI